MEEYLTVGLNLDTIKTLHLEGWNFILFFMSLWPNQKNSQYPFGDANDY